MLACEIFRTDVKGRKIDAIDEILLRQFGETDLVRTTMPVKMDRPAATAIQPFAEGTRDSRTIALMKLRQPDENVGITEEPAKRIQFLIGRRSRVFGQDDSGNVSARSP